MLRARICAGRPEVKTRLGGRRGRRSGIRRRGRRVDCIMQYAECRWLLRLNICQWTAWTTFSWRASRSFMVQPKWSRAILNHSWTANHYYFFYSILCSFSMYCKSVLALVCRVSSNSLCLTLYQKTSVSLHSRKSNATNSSSIHAQFFFL